MPGESVPSHPVSLVHSCKPSELCFTDERVEKTLREKIATTGHKETCMCRKLSTPGNIFLVSNEYT